MVGFGECDSMWYPSRTMLSVKMLHPPGWFIKKGFDFSFDLHLIQRLVTIQDAVLCQLRDDDLSVVQAALSLKGLSEIISPSDLLKALDGVLKKCVSTLRSGMCD